MHIVSAMICRLLAFVFAVALGAEDLHCAQCSGHDNVALVQGWAHVQSNSRAASRAPANEVLSLSDEVSAPEELSELRQIQADKNLAEYIRKQDSINVRHELLKAHSKSFVNRSLVGALLLMSAVCGFGHLLSARGTSFWCVSKERFPAWRVVLLAASFLLLFPGVACKMFSYCMYLHAPSIMLFSIPIFVNPNVHREPLRESTLSLIRAMSDDGHISGAFLVALFAVIVPAATLLFLCLGELWRNTERVKTSRRCILLAQAVSKWATPNMFCMMMFFCLFKNMGHVKWLEPICVLDVGFTYYCLACIALVGSTISISLPAVSADSARGPVESEMPLVVRHAGKGGVVYAVGGLCLVWGVLFIVGLGAPCFNLEMNPGKVNVDALYRPALEEFGSNHLEGAKVSIFKSMKQFANWYGDSHDLNLLLSSFVIFIFVVMSTGLSMLMLLIAAWRLRVRNEEDARLPCPFMSTACLFKHFAMLDAAIVGSLLLYASSSRLYKSGGMSLEISWGVFMLIAAELMHYVTYRTVLGAVQHFTPVDDPAAVNLSLEAKIAY
eukprot:gnl/TRDRNA2_/TRDRNA2_159371_c0_seq4.p1 gnl/TRDRNA2_/TRDRNA2_159371_c0~~gnl/TRDRNA2_/TRDRNA2_159371_c0_seq4.p1  ORF type:complete len:554 (-),score=75.89 gnl/TRDRNA2_/TRDRNA2_159371_c0_seq4:70-1731(-)